MKHVDMGEAPVTRGDLDEVSAKHAETDAAPATHEDTGEVRTKRAGRAHAGGTSGAVREMNNGRTDTGRPGRRTSERDVPTAATTMATKNPALRRTRDAGGAMV